MFVRTNTCHSQRPVYFLVFCFTVLRLGIMSLNESKIMNVIRNYNEKNVGCPLLAFQLACFHSKTDVYETDFISASLCNAYIFWCWRVSTIRLIATLQQKPVGNHNVDNVHFTKIYPRFGFADLAQNVHMRSSKNSNIH